MQLGRLATLMSPERRYAPLSSLTSLHKTPKLHEPMGVQTEVWQSRHLSQTVNSVACKAEVEQASSCATRGVWVPVVAKSRRRFRLYLNRGT
jgi:hypothetical protein